MRRALRFLFVDPFRWAVQEVSQWVLGIGLLVGAWWIADVSGGRWWVALILGTVFVAVLCRVWVWSASERSREELVDGEPSPDEAS